MQALGEILKLNFHLSNHKWTKNDLSILIMAITLRNYDLNTLNLYLNDKIFVYISIKKSKKSNFILHKYSNMEI